MYEGSWLISLIWVSVLCFLRCFHTVGFVTGRESSW